MFFDAIDAWMLRATEKVARAFSWLTGKNNFALAKMLILLTVGWFIVLALATIIFEPTDRVIYFSTCMALLCPLMYFRYRDVAKDEQKAEAERMSGAKSLSRATQLRFGRVIAWGATSTTMLFTIVMVLEVSYFRWLYGLTLLPYFAMTLFTEYLRSIDRPPYAKSQLPDFIRSLAIKAKEVFTPSPIPIPAPMLVPMAALIAGLFFIF